MLEQVLIFTFVLTNFIGKLKLDRDFETFSGPTFNFSKRRWGWGRLEFN